MAHANCSKKCPVEMGGRRCVAEHLKKQTWGDAGAARRANPGDAEHEAGERRLLLGQPAGLRKEAHVHRPALLHRQGPKVSMRHWARREMVSTRESGPLGLPPPPLMMAPSPEMGARVFIPITRNRVNQVSHLQ
uniref:Uncharacterized protein n=1 Tax=Aegilops tauschii TaxID=37682 RepID=M8CSG8_AEGTA